MALDRQGAAATIEKAVKGVRGEIVQNDFLRYYILHCLIQLPSNINLSDQQNLPILTSHTSKISQKVQHFRNPTG